MEKVKEIIVEQAFSKVPGWWPRAYLALMVFGFFRESRYVAPAYALRDKAKHVGLGKTTLYKGLEMLIKEGLVKKDGSMYILTDRGVSLLQKYQWIEEEIIKSIESNDITSLNYVLEEIRKLPENTEFEKYGKEYLTHMAYLATTIIERSMRFEITR